MFRKTIFWLHLAAGLVAGAVILVMSVTGAALAFERQIVAFAERGYRSASPQPPLEAQALLAAAWPTLPPESAPSSLTLRADPAAPAALAYGREKMLYLDRRTGAVLGEGTRLRAFFQGVTEWHRWLGGREKGRPITGVCNAAFLFLVVSGIYLWCPRGWPWQWRRKSFILWFRRGLRGKAREFNWHNVIGFWSAPVLVALTATGVVMSYPWASNLLYTLNGEKPPAPRVGRPGGGRGERSEPKGPAAPGGLDAWFAAARAQAPGFRSVTVNFPKPGGRNVTATVEEAGTVNPYARSTLTLDAASAAVVRWEPLASTSPGQKLRRWVRPVHTGEAAGLPGQVIAGAASAGGAFLVWTGFALSWRRFFGRRRDDILQREA